MAAPDAVHEAEEGKRVAVIGGGLAGLSAAIHLAEKGLGVEVFERFDLLGGKLKGWDTLLPNKKEAGSQPVEHGMHGWWTHYRNFRKFFERARPKLVPVRRIWWADALRLNRQGGGRWEVDEKLLDGLFGLWNLWNLLKVWRWPLYFRIARTGVGVFGFWDAFRVFLAAAALRFYWFGWVFVRLFPSTQDLFAFLSPKPPEHLDKKTIREFVESLPVGPRISQFFDVLTGMGTYGKPTEQSALHISRLLDFYVLRSPRAIWFDMCADSAHADGVHPVVEEAHRVGVDIHTHRPVARLERAGKGWKVHTGNGASTFDHVVLALDINGAERLLGASDEPALAKLEESVSKQALNTVLAVRIWFRKRIPEAVAPPYALALSAAAEADCPFDFVFIPSLFQPRPRNSGGEVIEFHISYADRYKTVPRNELEEKILPWAFRLFPDLECPDPIVHTALSEINNYSRVPPHHLETAPEVAGAADGLYLCGDWIRWDTSVVYMEKAWVTGMAAAVKICEREGLEPPEILPLEDPAPYQVAAQRLVRKPLPARAIPL